MSSGPESQQRESPYFGLDYYEEKWGAWFFGREAERRKVITNLRAARLTLLHAESGVGKSSLLRAGVAWRLNELAREAAMQGDAIDVPVVFSAWRDDPTAELIRTIERMLEPFLEGRPGPELPNEHLDQAIEAAADAVNGNLLLILDQFEEYFLYSSRETPPERFADELARCVNRPDLPASFLIAIREDAYAGLGDLFKGRIGNVYGNYLHVDYLDRGDAHAAICKPLTVYNEQTGAKPVEIEPALVDAVLDQVRTGGDGGSAPSRGNGAPAQAGGDGGSTTSGVTAHDGDGDLRVATPLLQLVMETVWERERAEGSQSLRLSTLERLEGVERIVDTHLARALQSLEPEQREIALDVFDHLVTPSGGKIAESVPDLARRSGHDEGPVGNVLAKLDHARIVRPVPASPGRDPLRFRRYEIFHDVLAPAINRAIATSEEQRLQRERNRAQEQARTERERARKFRRLAVAACALLALVAVVGVLAAVEWRQAISDKNTAQSRRLAASAETEASKNPELATLLALQALRYGHTQEAETALRDALPQLQLRATLAPAAPQRSVAFTPDGNQVLSASADGTIRLSDSGSGGQVASFGHYGGLNSASLSPDGKRIVATYNDGTARIIDASSGAALGSLTPPGGSALSSASYSPDGKRILTTGGDGRMRIWDARTDRQLGHSLADPQGATLLAGAFSPSGDQVAAGTSTGHALIWDLASRQLVDNIAASYRVLDVGYSPDGRRLITADGDGSARIWEVASSQGITTITPFTPSGQTYDMFSARFSPDGKEILTSGGDGVARIWNANSGTQLRALAPTVPGAVVEASFSRDGSKVATASAGGAVTVFSASSGKRITSVSGDQGGDRLNGAAFSPAGAVAATASQYGTVTIYGRVRSASQKTSWQPQQVIAIPGEDGANSVAFTPDGKQLAVAAESGLLYIYQVSGGLPIEQLAASNQRLDTAAFDPVNSNLVLAGGVDGQARLFNVKTLKQVGQSFGPHSEVNSAAFSPDGRQIVTVDTAGDAQAWNASTQKPLGASFSPENGSALNSAMFSADGKQLLFAVDNGKADVYNAGGGHSYVGQVSEPGTSRILSAAFSPDARVLATAASDGMARLWDASSDQQLLPFGGHTGPVEQVAFNRSGSEVITASADGTARIWDAAPIEQRTLLPGTVQLLSVAFDPANPSIVATADSSGTVKLWNVAHAARPFAVLKNPSGAAGDDAQFSRDGRLLVTMGGTEQARIWSLANLSKPLTVLDASKANSPCNSSHAASGANPGFYSASFSADATMVVTSDNDGSACIWNASAGQATRMIIEPPGASGGVGGAGAQGAAAVRQAVFSADGQRLLTAADDGTARIWSTSTGSQLQIFAEPTGENFNDVAFSPDDKRVVTSSDDGTARVWDAASGRQLSVLNEPDGSQVYNARFSPNGKLVVTCGGTAHIFDAATGQRLTDFQYGNAISDCEFRPDGTEIATAGDSGEVRIFSTELAAPLDQLVAIANQRVTTSLTAAERKTYGIS